MNISSLFLAGLAIMAGVSSAMAGSALTIRDAAQKAITTSPDVEARWHAFLAATEEQGVARGGFLPRVDLTAGIGRERLDTPAAAVANYSRSNATLSLTQMLYDGHATKGEIERLGYARLVRYYEILDAAENTALEAVRAYEDVLRFRELVEQARENYVQHKLVFDQVKQRAESGVGRRVDLELAGGRLALAESNLLTEAANLHDVSARYQRIIGELPGEALAPTRIPTTGTPGQLGEALKLAYNGNPSLNAATEYIRTAQAELRGRDAPFRPRLDFRAREDLGRNIDGVAGNRHGQVVELLLNFNLYKGGSDLAARRQYGERLNQARDLRDKACRDLRQTLAIAHNDIARLMEQLDYLGQHQIAIAKARVAYRQQFDIGQRTLLDLLDIQNEYFQASRAHASAQHDLSIARARTLAGMGRLLAALRISRDALPMSEEAAPERAGGDPASACPPEGPDMLRFDKQAILDDALKSGAARPFLAPRPRPAAVELESLPPTLPAAAMPPNSWYGLQNPRSYVLQISSLNTAQEADAFVATQGLKDCHTYTRQRDGQHVLTCGLYPTRSAARQAATGLPSKARGGSPIPSRIEDILKAIQP